MNNYLRHIAERGAGFHTGYIAPAVPSRFAQPFDVPTIISQPASAALMNEPTIETPRAEDQPAADDSLPRVALTPSSDVRSSPPVARTNESLLQAATTVGSNEASLRVATTAGSTMDRQHDEPIGLSRVEILPAMAKDVQSPMMPPTPSSPSRSQPESIEHDDESIIEATPVEAIALPAVRVEPPFTRQVDDRIPVETKTESAEAALSSSPAPRVTVRLEPSLPVESPRMDTRSTAVPPDADAPIEMRMRPLLVRERMVLAPSRSDVRVSIGRIDVRVESNPPPLPEINPPVEPFDPFASLSLARRGWRAPF